MRKLITLLLCAATAVYAADVEFSSKASITSVDDADFIHVVNSSGLSKRLVASLFNLKVGGAVNATAVSGNFSLTNTAASATVASTTWSVSAQAYPNPDLCSVAIGAASATVAGIVTAQAQSFAGAKTFNDALTANGITSSNTLTVVGTANAAIRTVGSTSGFFERTQLAAGQSNSLSYNITAPAVGNLLIMDSVTDQAGTNNIGYTNIASSGSGSVIRAHGAGVGSMTIQTNLSAADITTTNNIKYLSAELTPQSQDTNYTADFTFTTRSKSVTNAFHLSAVSNLPTDGIKTWTCILRNFTGTNLVASIATTIPRNGTNFVTIANAKKALVTLMSDGSGGGNITNLVGSITLMDSP